MRLSLPFLLCVLVASLHYSTEAERFSDSRYQLGRALLRRAREINETTNNADELEDEKEDDMSEEERERVQQIDAAEDIFVGSGNHVYESQGKSDNSGSKRGDTSGDEDSEAEEPEAETDEDDNSPTSGDSNEGDDESDDDDDEKSDDDDDDDGTETKKDQEATEDEDASGSGLIENENAARRSSDDSASGSGSEQQDDETDQSGSGESTIQELTPTAASQDELSGDQSINSGEEETADYKKSDIETVSGDSDDEEEDSGSADVIKKGIESLSRLLTPVASGYDFELFSGNAAKNDKEEETEADGESEKGFSSNTEGVHVKKCKRVCEDPMTYKQCAVPRCDYKMGTIKDLCVYLCRHQTPVCSQQCE